MDEQNSEVYEEIIPEVGDLEFADDEDLIIELDFTGVETRREPIPVGTYQAVVSDIKYIAKSKKSGNPTLKFIFQTMTDDEFDGRDLFDNYALTEAALWKLGRTMEAFGETLPQGPIRYNFRKLIGAGCLLIVGQQPYQRRMTNTVEDVLPLEDMVEPLEE